MSDFFTLPTTSLSGGTIMLDPEVQQVIDWLHNGYSPFGWEGDHRLALYRIPGKRWELVRFEENGREVIVMRSRPSLALDQRLILHLVKHDARRGHDSTTLLKAAVAENDLLEERRTNEAVDKLMDPALKTYHALARDLHLV